MDILLQNKLCWLNPVQRHVWKECSQIKLLSKEGQVTCVPAQFLTATSTFLKSILKLPSSMCESSAISISLPSATSSTLKLLAQILCLGETEESGGLEITMSNMKELKDVIAMLGLDVNLCPKFTKETGPYEWVVKEEVSDVQDNYTPTEAQNNCDKMIKQKSTVAKMSSSSGKFRQSRILKEFKEKIIKKFNGGNLNREESCEELDTDCSAPTPQKSANIQALKRSSSGMLKQSGLLKEVEVKLEQCATNLMLKKSSSEEERSLKCNICGVKFSKYLTLRRHCREKHGIQDGMHGREVVKPSVKKCPQCDQRFRFRGSLSRHLKRVHNSEKKQDLDSGVNLHHKCGECDEMFCNFHHLQRHRKLQHSKMMVAPVDQEIAPASCQDCGLVSSSMNDMIQHCHEVHKRSNDLTENVKTEVVPSNESVKGIKCYDCGKRFNRRSDLRKHTESYHEGRTYGCGECNVTCLYRSSMVRHCAVKGHDKELIFIVVDLPSTNLEMY